MFKCIFRFLSAADGCYLSISYFVVAAHQAERNRNQKRRQSLHSFPLDRPSVDWGKLLDLQEPKSVNLFSSLPCKVHIIRTIIHSIHSCIRVLLLFNQTDIFIFGH